MASSITNFIKAGFGLSVGFQLATIIFMFVGFLFFLPGYILYKKEKDAGRKGSTMEIIGVILMGLGVIIMGGFGFGMLLDGMNNSF